MRKSDKENIKCREILKRMCFTMIELLVVISVIIILAGLLLPSLSKAKQVTKQISCLNNLKQNGLHWNMYSDDNNDYYLPFYDETNYRWTDYIFKRNVLGKIVRQAAPPYLVYPDRQAYQINTFLCPSPEPHSYYYNNILCVIDYGYNSFFFHRNWNSSFGSMQIKRSQPNKNISKSLVFADAWKAGRVINGSYLMQDFWRRSQYLDIGIYAAHPSGMNQLFFDLHAETLNYVWCNDSTTNYFFNVWDPGNVIQKR